mmetsp:Transcript_98105/g.194233  ORF Transcript_98105/g.194233 Transcript_98105/m.194233 type:complete len:1420 (+) Transcript_98105:41-4300(+)
MTPAPASSPEEETNVRVAARVRPLLPREQAANCCSCVTVHPESNQLIVGTRRAFAFDVAFDVDSTQDQVYNECVAPLLAGCMQGYNATILAYGQTGSGKTHTMGTGHEVGAESHDEEGIAPKLVRNSFEHFIEQGDEIDFKASCCYIEIYNEEIRDLLQPNAPRHLIAVRETTDGVIQVAGIKSEACDSAEQMLRCLSDGSLQRTTGATLMNEQSSRSHSIFTIILEQRRRGRWHAARRDGEEAATGGCVGDEVSTTAGGDARDDFAFKPVYRTAKFHLVDLAGSERAKRTGAVGSRFKESVSINSGLLALGNVISALGDPAKRGFHVPYRESKLTRLLQDGLGGNSRTLMVACASCADGDFEETLNTLKYAHRARNIKNKPVVNVDPKVAQLAAMQDEIEALRGELRRVSAGGNCTPLRPSSVPPLPITALGAEGGIGSASPDDGVVTQLRAAERRSEELAARVAGLEAEGEVLRRALLDMHNAVREHLPSIYQASFGHSGATGEPPQTARQALTAVSMSLQAARRLLGDAAATSRSAGGDEAAATPPLGISGSGELLPSTGDIEGSAADASDSARLRSLADMRRDSTMLIRKYLDEIKRLETELALYRRRNKQLQEELQETRDDLRRDEEIFEEKVREMRALEGRNDALHSELQEAYTAARGMLHQSSPLPGASGLSEQGLPGASGLSEQGSPQFCNERSEEVMEVAVTEAATPLAEPIASRGTSGACGAAASPSDLMVDEAVQAEVEESRETQERLQQELQALSVSVTKKEDLIAELVRKERDSTAQHHRRMLMLQADLDRMQQELADLKSKMEESTSLKEQTRHMEEEKRRLEQLIAEQVDCIRRKQQEFGKLRDLRQQDTRRIRELEAEVSNMNESQRDKEAKLQAERRREAQQIGELQRRLAREGQRVKDLEAENHRQKESLKLGRAPTSMRQRSAAPMSRTGSSTASLHVGRAHSVDVTRSGRGGDGGGGSSSSSSTYTRAQLLEQRIDEHIRRQEAAQAMDEDLRKQESLLRKREQYLIYRHRIAAKDAVDKQDEQKKFQLLEKQMTIAERELTESAAAVDTESAAQRARKQREALGEEHDELQKQYHAKRAEGLGILHDIDERLEGLQDEIDFREMRITKAKQMAKPSSGRSSSLEAELVGVAADDAKELIRRYCEKIVRMRHRERQGLRRLAAAEAQLQDKHRQVSELQRMLQHQSANASLDAARLTQEHEGQVQLLLQQLEAVHKKRRRLTPGECTPASPSPRPAPEAITAPLADSGASIDEAVCTSELSEIQQLRRDALYLRSVNKELKKRLRCALERDPDKAGAGRQNGTGSSEDPVGGRVGSELAAQVERLQHEKEALVEENGRVMAQVHSLMQLTSRFQQQRWQQQQQQQQHETAAGGMVTPGVAWPVPNDSKAPVQSSTPIIK